MYVLSVYVYVYVNVPVSDCAAKRENETYKERELERRTDKARKTEKHKFDKGINKMKNVGKNRKTAKDDRGECRVCVCVI